MTRHALLVRMYRPDEREDGWWVTAAALDHPGRVNIVGPLATRAAATAYISDVQERQRALSAEDPLIVGRVT